MKRLVLTVGLIIGTAIFAVSGPGIPSAQTFRFGTDAPLEWQTIRGSASDVGIGPSGSVYVVSRTGRVWRWGSVLGEEWKTMSGRNFARIDVGTSGKPWTVTRDGQIRFFNGLWWEVRGKGFVDIGVARRGAVYAVGLDQGVSRWDSKKRTFSSLPLQPAGRSAVRVDVDENGQPWVVTADGEIVTYDGSQWHQLPGLARDISIGPKGNVFAVLQDGSVAIWDKSTNQWQPVKGVADIASVSTGPGAKPWAIDQQGRIFATSLFLPERLKQVSQSGVASAPEVVAKKDVSATPVDPATQTDAAPIRFTKVAGSAQDIAIGADGSVFIVTQGGAGLGLYSNLRHRFVDFPGALIRIAVAADGAPWGVNGAREVFRHDGRDWKKVLGAAALDIAVGGEAVFVTDKEEKLYRYDSELRRMVRFPRGRGKRVAVDPAGYPWTVDGTGRVSRCDVSPCARVSSQAVDIEIGPDGSVFVTDEKGRLKLFDDSAAAFRTVRAVRFLARAVSVGPGGRPWVLDVNGGIYAATFFDRDESRDRLVAARTVTQTGSEKKSVFTFSRNIPFEATDVSALSDAAFLDIAIGADGTIVLVEKSTIKTTTTTTSTIVVVPATEETPETTKTVITTTTTTSDDRTQQSVYKFDTRRDAFVEETRTPSEFGDAVAVDPDGEYWIVNKETANVYEQRGNSFRRRSGLQSGGSIVPDMGIGADGSVFAIDTQGKIFKFNSSAGRFSKFTATGTYSKIAVDPLGVPWAIDSDGIVYQYDGSKFERRPRGGSQTATDIGVGAGGSVFINVPSDGALRRWNSINGKFDNISTGKASRLDVTPGGRPWFIGASDQTVVSRPRK